MREAWVLSLGWEDSPGEGKGYPLQYSGLENSMDCIVHRVVKSWTQPSDFHFHGSFALKVRCVYSETLPKRVVPSLYLSIFDQKGHQSQWILGFTYLITISISLSQAFGFLANLIHLPIHLSSVM